MPLLPDERQARLAAIRQQIADGTYETPDKLEAAVDRLLAVLEDDTPAEPVPAPHLPRQPR